MELFDTHFHLPDEGDTADYLQQLLPEHNYRMLTLGGSLAGSVRALEFARQHANVWAACGVHPHDAGEFDGNITPFEEMLADQKIRAVGEIGLDYFYDFSPRDQQKKCFEKFLALAIKHQKPVSVHCRDQENRREAYTDCYAMLKEFAAASAPGRIVLHCYAGNLEFLEKFLELGAYIGVTGMVTFPKSSNIRENLQHIPLDRLLFETDSPYLAPVPFRGKPNHPALVAQVVKYSAEFLGMEPEFLAEKTTANAMKFFDLKEL